jgi:hypothetical protein
MMMKTEDCFYLCINEDHSVQDYRYEEITDAAYLNFVLTLSIGQTQMILYPSDIYFHHLMRKLPRGLKSFDYEPSDNFYNNLMGCPICGLLAKNGIKCLACEFDESVELFGGNYTTKEEQLNHFSYWYEETGELKNQSFGGFQSDPNWKLLITLEELKEWDKDDS